MNDTTFTVYEITGNSDQTEGRGHEVVRERFTTARAALQRFREPSCVRIHGVQGVAGVSVRRTVFTVDDNDRVSTEITPMWGLVKGPPGQWRDGYLNLEEVLADDPEYAEFLRLSEKFKRIDR